MKLPVIADSIYIICHTENNRLPLSDSYALYFFSLSFICCHKDLITLNLHCAKINRKKYVLVSQPYAWKFSLALRGNATISPRIFQFSRQQTGWSKVGSSWPEYWKIGSRHAYVTHIYSQDWWIKTFIEINGREIVGQLYSDSVAIFALNTSN